MAPPTIKSKISSAVSHRGLERILRGQGGVCQVTLPIPCALKAELQVSSIHVNPADETCHSGGEISNPSLGHKCFLSGSTARPLAGLGPLCHPVLLSACLVSLSAS